MLLLATLACAVTPRAARAQRGGCTPRHPMVDAVGFRGTHVVQANDLVPIIATEKTGLYRRWFGWNTGPLTCLDTVELRRDAIRIRDYYDQRGYPGTVVSSSVTRRGRGRAQVTFTVREVAPLIIDSVTVSGLPGEAADSRTLVQRLLHAPLDDSLFSATIDSVQRLIRNAGYANVVAPDTVVREDTAHHRATISIAFRPGRVVYVGDISVQVTSAGGAPALTERDVRRLLWFSRGDRYSARKVGASERDLFNLELYRSVRIDAGTPADSGSDTVPILVKLVEGPRQRVRAGGGWGTLDCFRTQGRFVEQNLLHSGHRLELNARLSKIGLAHPFAGFNQLCAPRVREDPFSRRLGYYLGATVNLRGILGANLKPAITVFSEHRSEFETYEQSTDIGVTASLTRELAPLLNGTLQYQYVDGKTTADAAVSCTIFGFCRAQDLATFVYASPIHTFGVGFAKNPLLPTSDPVTGYRWQAEAKYGYTRVARSLPLQFERLLGEGALYRPAGPDVVVAARVQFGYVFAPNDRSYLLPPDERFYGGGQNSVRGFNQNLLGPGSYIVTAFDTVTSADGVKAGVARAADGYARIAPSGGNATVLANLEFRSRRGWPTDILRWVLFVDAGRVWNTNDVFSVTNADLRITPGAGARLMTPLGPFRIDVGYNPYPLEAGPAYFVRAGDVRTGQVGRVVCVSPGTTDPITDTGPTAGGAVDCPASFLPTKRGGLLPRLTFHFSIGNAF